MHTIAVCSEASVTVTVRQSAQRKSESRQLLNMQAIPTHFHKPYTKLVKMYCTAQS